ncbi:MAG TPA: 2-dehydropantoate 2-reductase N-terminal domain-containing protein, partial [Rhodopila sp.]
MKICIYGAGAIGGHLAARLYKAGADVSVIARGPHLAAIKANGLTVHAVDGEHHAPVRAAADPAELGQQDAVFVTVKAPALPAVAASLKPLLGPDTSVAFVMNGIPWWYFDHLRGPHEGKSLPRIDPGDALRRALGPGRAIGGVVYSASAVTEPGVVHVEQPKSR